jgi:hypothetical protein
VLKKDDEERSSETEGPAWTEDEPTTDAGFPPLDNEEPVREDTPDPAAGPPEETANVDNSFPDTEDTPQESETANPEEGTEGVPPNAASEEVQRMMDKSLEKACKSLENGVPLTTERFVDIRYVYKLVTDTGALYAGIAVNNAVQKHFQEIYLHPLCDEWEFEQTQGDARNRRLAADLSGIRGISSGVSEVLGGSCDHNLVDPGVACFKLEASNTVFFDENIDVEDAVLQEAILTDLNQAFETGTIQGYARETEPGLLGLALIEGSSGEVSVRGQAAGGDGDDGMSGAGIAFLVLFILLIVALAIVGVWKRKALMEWYKRRRERKREGTSAGTRPGSSFGSKFKSSLQSWKEKKSRRSTDEQKSLDEGAAKEHIVVSNTVESASTGEEAGTEVALERSPTAEARDEEEGWASFRKNERETPFTPDTLPDDEEEEVEYSYSANYNDMSFSRSRIQVMVDESSSYDGSSYRSPSRSYTSPDTVQL